MATEPSRRPRDDLSPDGIARRTFSTSFRGFDQLEVRGFLNAVAGELASLLDRQEQLRHELEETRARLAAAEEADVHRLTMVLGEETARVLEAAREAAGQMRAKAEESVARMLQEASDESARARAEADAVLAQRTEEAEAEAARIRAAAEEIRAAAAAAADAEVEAARERGREMVGEAQVVRERVLRDLARRRKLARQQLEQLRAGRDRLLAAYQVVRRTLDEATGELSMAMVEAKAAAESAGRRAAEAEEPTQEELEAELAVLRSGPPRGAVPAPAPEPAAVAVGAPAAAPASEEAPPPPAGGDRPPGPVLRFGDGIDEPPAVTLPPVAGPPPLAPAGRRRFRRRSESDAETSAERPEEAGWQPVEGGAPFEGIRVIAPDAPPGAPEVRLTGATPAADLAPNGAATAPPAAPAEAPGASPADGIGTAERSSGPSTATPAEGSDRAATATPAEASDPAATAAPAEASDRAATAAPPEAGDPGGTSTSEPSPAEPPAEQPVPTGPTAPSTEPPGVPDGPGPDPAEPSPAVPPTEPLPSEPPTEPLPAGPPTEPLPPRPEPVAPEPAPPDEPPPAPVAGRSRPSVEELFARIKASRAESVARAEAVLAADPEPVGAPTTTAAPATADASTADAAAVAAVAADPDPAAAAPAAAADPAVADLLAADPAAAPAAGATSDAPGAASDAAGALSDAAAPAAGATSDAAGAASDADAGPEPAPDGEAAPPPAAALLRRRDEAVAGPERSLSRKLKRSLSDEQNAVLDTLRRQRGTATIDELLGSPEDHRRRVATLVTPDLLAAAAAGAATSGDARRDLHPAVDPVAVDLAAALVDPLRDRIERAVTEGEGDEDGVAERLRASYREWKTQRIPDVTRHATAAAYAAGVVAAVPPGTRLCWLVDTGGAPCPDAEDNALAGAVPAGEPFPTGHTVPPAHPGCRCLAVREDALRSG